MSQENSWSESFCRSISVMGSTGSIGRQTLDVAARYPERFRINALTARSNWQLLAEQALAFRPRLVVISDDRFLIPLKKALEGTPIEVASGEEGLVEAATLPDSDIVVGALVGYSGLPSTIAALNAGKRVALANKETLVVAGEIIEKIVRREGKKILPVDSEHSAIFQCLLGENRESVAKIILTASGGPFRKTPLRDLESVTVEEALNHPNWDMGAKVTIDSATMMNKGFEMIEARWLFDIKPENIEVVVHPESVVHSLVEFIDGSLKAQLGVPDMRIPIEVALSHPERLDLLKRSGQRRLSLAETGSLTFEKPDTEKFPLLELAYRAAEDGGLVPAVMNAANEVAVRSFIEKRISFTDISRLVIKAVELTESRYRDEAVTLESISAAHEEGMEIARNLINS